MAKQKKNRIPAAATAPREIIVYLKDHATAWNKVDADATRPKWLLDLLNDPTRVFDQWPRGGGWVERGARPHKRAWICAHCAVTRHGFVAADAVIGGETLCHGRVYGGARTNGARRGVGGEAGIIVAQRANVCASVELIGHVKVGDFATLAGNFLAHGKSAYGVELISGVFKDEVSVHDFVLGGSKPPAPIRIENAFGSYELSGDLKFTCQAQVKAHFDSLQRIRRGLERQV
jgi:hypothetical protein